jgi:hypothetical protein
MKYVDPKTGRLRRVAVNRREVPIEVMQLAEDAFSLRLACKLLSAIEGVNQTTLAQLKHLEWQISQQLRDYLAP